jgi:hypothetical protein
MMRFTGIALLSLGVPVTLFAHGIEGGDAAFVAGNSGTAIGSFLYLGAKHMVTGYDHILFLIGIIFFLYRLKDVALYVSLFTLGHSITLLVGVLGGVHANAYIVDAIIGLSVVYKALDNMHAFEKIMGFRPNVKAAVMIFGLFHGFGLATKLQEFSLSEDGLLGNMISFNIGVEIGQVLALTAILIGFGYWRRHQNFFKHAFIANTAIMAGGFLLMGYQIVGYILN